MIAGTYSLNLQLGFRINESHSSSLSLLFHTLQWSQIAVKSLYLCIDTSMQTLSHQNQFKNNLSSLLEGIEKLSLCLSYYCETDSDLLKLVSFMRSLKCLKIYLTHYNDSGDFWVSKETISLNEWTNILLFMYNFCQLPHTYTALPLSRAQWNIIVTVKRSLLNRTYSSLEHPALGHYHTWSYTNLWGLIDCCCELICFLYDNRYYSQECFWKSFVVWLLCTLRALY